MADLYNVAGAYVCKPCYWGVRLGPTCWSQGNDHLLLHQYNLHHHLLLYEHHLHHHHHQGQQQLLSIIIIIIIIICFLIESS